MFRFDKSGSPIFEYRVSDKAKIGTVASPSQIKKLNDTFTSEFGYRAQPSFLKAALEKRAGTQLSLEQKIRAELLHAC